MKRAATAHGRVASGAVLAALAWLTSASVAQTQSAPALLGSGAMSCGQFVRGKESARSIVHAWVLGHLSRANVRSTRDYGIDFLAQVKSEDVRAWLDKRCRQRPLETVQKAAFDLELEILARNAGAADAARALKPAP